MTVKRNDFQPWAIHYLISTDGWLILFRNKTRWWLRYLNRATVLKSVSRIFAVKKEKKNFAWKYREREIGKLKPHRNNILSNIGGLWVVLYLILYCNVFVVCTNCTCFVSATRIFAYSAWHLHTDKVTARVSYNLVSEIVGFRSLLPKWMKIQVK